MALRVFITVLSLLVLGVAGQGVSRANAQAAMGRDILDEWGSVQPPPAPAVAEVKLDAKGTALLVLDMQNALVNNSARPRAAASVPAFAKLLARARAAGVFVAYSTIPNGTGADIIKELAPLAADPVVHAGVDKFFGTELDTVLKAHGIKTVIVTGTVANGAVLFTATGAALRGYRVVVPVDCMPAGDPYAEQFTAWQLVNGPGTRSAATLARSTGIGF